MKIFTFILMLIMFTMFLVGQSYYQNERDLSPINDILVWEELEFINYSINYNESGFDNVSVQSIRVSNILTSAINFFGYATFELCKCLWNLVINIMILIIIPSLN